MKPKEKPYFSFSEIFVKFMFLCIDGVAFFSVTAEHKLPRLTGRKPGWMDKLHLDIPNLVLWFIEFVIVLAVVLQYIDIYKEIKSQEVVLKPESFFNFTATENFPLLGVSYFNVDELFNVVRNDPDWIYSEKYIDM